MLTTYPHRFAIQFFPPLKINILTAVCTSDAQIPLRTLLNRTSRENKSLDTLRKVGFTFLGSKELDSEPALLKAGEHSTNACMSGSSESRERDRVGRRLCRGSCSAHIALKPSMSPVWNHCIVFVRRNASFLSCILRWYRICGITKTFIRRSTETGLKLGHGISAPIAGSGSCLPLRFS